jgi:hypothetical protein
MDEANAIKHLDVAFGYSYFGILSNEQKMNSTWTTGEAL